MKVENVPNLNVLLNINEVYMLYQCNVQISLTTNFQSDLFIHDLFVNTDTLFQIYRNRKERCVYSISWEFPTK